MKKIREIHKISQEIFLRLTGVSQKTFEEMYTLLEEDSNAQENSKAKTGRPHEIGGLKEHLLLLLIAYRSYLTQEILGYLLFNVDKSTICRSLKRIEKIALDALGIKKNQTLKKEELEALIVDCTEQRIERPKAKKEQTRYYSGKKKTHTKKTEVIITEDKKIVYVSDSHEGSKHDLSIRRESRQFEQGHLYADGAYIGYDKEHKGVLDFPYRKPKGRELDEEEKEYNRGISRFRVRIEHVFGQLKIFKSLSERYRYLRDDYNNKFQIIAGINNLKTGF
jgi:DDE superfamily endonuclease